MAEPNIESGMKGKTSGYNLNSLHKLLLVLARVPGHVPEPCPFKSSQKRPFQTGQCHISQGRFDQKPGDWLLVLPQLSSRFVF